MRRALESAYCVQLVNIAAVMDCQVRLAIAKRGTIALRGLKQTLQLSTNARWAIIALLDLPSLRAARKVSTQLHQVLQHA